MLAGCPLSHPFNRGPSVVLKGQALFILRILSPCKILSGNSVGKISKIQTAVAEEGVVEVGAGVYPLLPLTPQGPSPLLFAPPLHPQHDQRTPVVPRDTVCQERPGTNICNLIFAPTEFAV